MKSVEQHVDEDERQAEESVEKHRMKKKLKRKTWFSSILFYKSISNNQAGFLILKIKLDKI